MTAQLNAYPGLVRALHGGFSLPTRRINPASFVTDAIEIGVPADVAERAALNLYDGNVMLFIVSGKLASGKDTIAPAVFDAFGITDREHQYYAKPLKDEVDAIIADLRQYWAANPVAAITAGYRAQLDELISVNHSIDLAKTGMYTGRLFDQVRIHAGVHARTRSQVMRRVLQYHGTDVRREQDEDYWVKRALNPAITALADGTSVFVTDARFPNEASVSSTFGAFVARLDIDSETQMRRLSSRDGLTVDPAALVHASETALDDYPSFDVRLDNVGTVEYAVTTVVDGLQSAAAA